MKGRKKLWLSFAFILLAGLFGRVAWIYIRETAGVVFIIISTVCVALALVVFGIYFKE